MSNIPSEVIDLTNAYLSLDKKFVINVLTILDKQNLPADVRAQLAVLFSEKSLVVSKFVKTYEELLATAEALRQKEELACLH